MPKRLLASVLFLVLSYVMYSQGQIFIPMAFWQDHPRFLSISDAVTYNYGTISTNTSVDKTFWVTNTSTTLTATSMTGGTFTNTRYTWKGGTYPGTGGDCATTLAAGAACRIVVTALSATAGVNTETVTVNYYDSISMSPATRPITANFTATPTRLKFITQDYIRVNECVAVTVQSQDDAGNPMNVGANTTVSLVLNNTTNTNFYTTNTCGTTTTSRTINSGTNSVTFYVQSTTANQSGIMVATATGLVTGEHDFLVTNNPARLYLVAVPQIKTNVCRPLIIRTVDNNYFPANATVLVTVNMTTSGANIYYSDSGCASSITSTTIASGTFQRVIYTRNATAQTNTLTATDNAAILTASSASVAFVASLSWWNASWTKRIRIDINNADQASTHTNMPVLFYLNSTNISYSDFLANGADVRFVAADQSTVLAHEFDLWNPGGASLIWVRVPTITASTPNNHIFMYYNNTGAADGQNPATTWSSYWSVWHMTEDPTNTAPQYNDPVGSRDGTAVNSPTRELGAIGYSAGLLTNSDVIDVNSDLSVSLGVSSTFSAWMKTSQVGNNTMWQAPGITGIEESGGGNDIFFGWIDGGGLIGVTAGNGANAKSDFIVNNNAWRHVTITRNSTSGAVEFFINGVSNNTATSETGAKTNYFDLLGEIMDTGGSPVNYDGLLDEVRIYNTVQSSARVLGDFKYMMNTHIIYNTFEVQ